MRSGMRMGQQPRAVPQTLRPLGRRPTRARARRGIRMGEQAKAVP